MRKTRPNFPRGKKQDRIEDKLMDSHKAFRNKNGTTERWEEKFDELFMELKKELTDLRRKAEIYNIHHLKRG